MAEAVKQEQTEGETVSLDNMKDLKGKKGANLIVMRTAVSARARSILQRIRAFSRISRAIPT